MIAVSEAFSIPFRAKWYSAVFCQVLQRWCWSLLMLSQFTLAQDCVETKARTEATVQRDSKASPLAGELGVGEKLVNTRKSVFTPGWITGAVRAGGGQYLLLTLGYSKKLVIVDLLKRKIAKILPLPTEDALVAGTKQYFFVLNPDNGILERFGVDDFAEQASIRIPFPGFVKSMTSGESSDGPLLFQVMGVEDPIPVGAWFVLDVLWLKEIPIAIERGLVNPVSSKDFIHVRCSANGSVFGMWSTSSSPQGVTAAIFSNGKVVMLDERISAGYVKPSSNGMHLFTGAKGVFALKQKSLSVARDTIHPNFPTSHPKFYLELPSGKNGMVRLVDTGTKLADLPDLELGELIDEKWANHDLTTDKRVFMDIDSRILVSIPSSDDRVIVQPFDFMEELEKSSIDYFFLSSSPPRQCTPGRVYSYQIKVESRDHELKYELTSGPPGMEVSDVGELTWRVPKDFGEPSVEVVVSVSSETNRLYESYTIQNSIAKVLTD